MVANYSRDYRWLLHFCAPLLRSIFEQSADKEVCSVDCGSFQIITTTTSGGKEGQCHITKCKGDSTTWKTPRRGWQDPMFSARHGKWRFEPASAAIWWATSHANWYIFGQVRVCGQVIANPQGGCDCPRNVDSFNWKYQWWDQYMVPISVKKHQSYKKCFSCHANSCPSIAQTTNLSMLFGCWVHLMDGRFGIVCMLLHSYILCIVLQFCIGLFVCESSTKLHST